MKSYPKIKLQTLGDVIEILNDITKERKTDVSEFNNLKNTFISGRKVGKIPTGAADVAATDRVGDFNYDASYLYLCVDNSGAAWRRVALSSW